MEDKKEAKSSICKRITKRSLANNMITEEIYLFVDGPDFKEVIKEFDKRWET